MQEQGEPVRVTGALIHQHLSVARERFGDGVVQRVLDRLPETERAELDEALPVSWVSGTTSECFFETLADELGQNLASLHTEMVRITVRRNAQSWWKRLYLRLGTDEALAKRGGSLLGRNYDRGAYAARLVEPGQLEIRVSGGPEDSPFLMRGMCAGIREILELSGRTRVTAEWTSAPGGARVTARWYAR